MIKNMDVNKKWYVIYTRSRCEKKVHSLLNKRGIESFCPLNKCYRKWADRNKIVMEPLFRSYVFVKVKGIDIVSIKQYTTDIVNVVYWLGKPAVVRDEEIDQIKLFLGEHQHVKIEKKIVRIDDQIRITQGIMMNSVGKINEIKNNIVKVMIPSLGYMLTAEVKVSDVEIININTLKTDHQMLIEMQ